MHSLLNFILGSQIAYANDNRQFDLTGQFTLSTAPDLLSLLIIPLIIAVIPIVVSFVLDYRTNERIKKSEYSSSRSEYVTRNRFDKEIDCIQSLSMNLLVLIQKTKRVVALSKVANAEVVEVEKPEILSGPAEVGQPSNLEEAIWEWETQHEKVIRSIGKAAPFLNYLNLDDSSIPYCGVSRQRSTSSDTGCRAEEGDCGASRPSIDKACMCSEKKQEEKYFDNDASRDDLALIEIQSSSDDSLFIDYLKVSPTDGAKGEAKRVGKNLYNRACEILLFCEYAKRTNDLGCIRIAGDCNGGAGSPHEYRTYLDCRYARFVNCAYCRLNAIEFGREGLRKRNKREHEKRTQPRAIMEENKMRQFDQRCPYK